MSPIDLDTVAGYVYGHLSSTTRNEYEMFADALNNVAVAEGRQIDVTSGQLFRNDLFEIGRLMEAPPLETEFYTWLWNRLSTQTKTWWRDVNTLPWPERWRIYGEQLRLTAPFAL